MTEKDDRSRRPLDRLKDTFLDDILNMSEEEILAEAREAGIDPAHLGTEMRQKFEQQLLASNRARMAAAREGAGRSRISGTRSSGEVVDIAKARARLRAAMDRGASLGLTMAARKESELSDADVLSHLEDLIELGVIPPDDGQDR